MKALDKRQRMLLTGILGALALILTLVLASISRKPAEEKGTDATLIPEADLREGDGSKTGSYRREGSIGDYWDSLEEGEAPVETVPPTDPRRPREVDVEDLFGDCAEPSRGSVPPSPRSGGGGGHAAARSSGHAPGEEGPVSLLGESVPAPEPDAPPRPQVKRSGAVSSLEEDVTEDLGNGFSTLDGTDRWVGAESGKAYRCMFTRDEKVRSGQRITVRLLEDLVIGSVHIPRNTHLQGVVSVSDRMEIAVTSLDMGGRIIRLHFEAYDTDGGKGIYCSDLSQTGKAVTEQGLSTLSSTLSSRLGRVARDAAAVGASIVRNKAGEATVSVTAGYTFYLIEKTQ